MLLGDMSNMDVMKENIHSSPTKSDKLPLVELKNGKVIFRQKPLSCEKMSETMQEIVTFRDYLRQLIFSKSPPLGMIPDEHIPLIAKLTHESDKTIGPLARHIQQSLTPEDLEEDEYANSLANPLTLPSIERAIQSVADRINYGMDWVERAPASLSVWRWEVREDKREFLPRASRERLESRISERLQAKQDLRAAYEALSPSEKDSLTKGGKRAKQESNSAPSKADESKQLETPVAASSPIEPKPSDSTEENSEAKKSGRPKKEKSLDPERVMKEKEKADKRAAKDERDRKIKEAQNKSRSFMSNFFAKPKGGHSNSLLRPGLSKPQKLEENEPSSSTSEFERTFKPFIVRKDATMAPINYFKREREVIVIDQDPPSPEAMKIDSPTTSARDPRELLKEFIASVPPEQRLPSKTFRPKAPKFKSESRYCVRDIMNQLSEAEVLGDVTAVRKIHALLRSRSRIPAKVLIFYEDTRPGYFGTFTKSSAVVGPRTPFAKDAVAFDYGYDSGAEWEEEEEGGDDLNSINGSEDDSSDVGSDEMDDWLVDDDEVEPGTPLSDRASPPPFPVPNEPPVKRKSATEMSKKETKRRKVMPLVPFAKGPCLEQTIGECDYEPFKQYRIQLFNDTPFPIDPFTFVSTPVMVERNTRTNKAFAVPALPSHAQGQSSSSSSATTSTLDLNTSTTDSTSDTVAKRATTVKYPFPPALLPYLADRVATLSSANITWLVESLYQDLRVHKVKKNAIEAKLKEVGEKCPVRKVWIVKEDVLRSIGKTPVAP